MDLSKRYRRKHRKQTAHRIYFVLACGVLCAILAWGFFWIPWIRIQTIEIGGNIDTAPIRAAIEQSMVDTNKYFAPKDNYFLTRAADIEQLVKDKDLGVAIVQIKFPRTITVNFPQREARFIICSETDTCYYMNNEGLLFNESPQFSEYPLPLITISPSVRSPREVRLGDQFADADTMRFINTTVRGLFALGITSKIIETNDMSEIKIFTPEDWYIYLNTKTDPVKTAQNIRLLMDQKIKNSRDALEYIDLRFENKAFYKLR